MEFYYDKRFILDCLGAAYLPLPPARTRGDGRILLDYEHPGESSCREASSFLASVPVQGEKRFLRELLVQLFERKF